MKMYPFSKIEKKWTTKWLKSCLYEPNLKIAKKPFYNLMMFPYPSAEGLHVGNTYAFTGSDIYGRFMRMQGYDVFEPIGLDGFGIHSENYALRIGKHPMKLAKVTEKNFYRQLQSLGNGFDWESHLETYDPDYYKWTQWIFIQMWKQGLAYRKKASVNWCPHCKTVLADEQVVNGECERCSTKVAKKELEQWFFRITKYAERLLKNLKKIDWSERIKVAQRNWIGKKEGINITYEVENSDLNIVCFTTRPDTNFGATFIVVGPEHLLVDRLATEENKKIVKDYVLRATKISDAERISQGRRKTGVFTGSFAINNLNGKRLPIWVSDFVLGNVGTGAVVGVPGHDIRDFEFAKEFKLPVIRVVIGKDGNKSSITKAEQVQEKEGIMVNSEFLNGLDIHKATEKIMDYLEEKGWGKRVTSYHLRDWLISRQRYWGPPIPMIHCDKCDWQPVPEKDLPVKLPFVKDFQPRGKGKSPLASVKSFYEVKCPRCKGPAKRETDVSDTFLDSSWYYLGYLILGNQKSKIKNQNWKLEIGNSPFSSPVIRKWCPVNMYIGGAEHAVLHLLYSRFVTMVFKDMGLLHFEEPFKTFRVHGLLVSEGAKMSKSKGNIVNPDGYIKKLGADTLRMYLMFLGPFEEGGDWRDAGIVGITRFLNRVWGFQKMEMRKSGAVSSWLPISIKKVTEDISGLRYNTAISELMIVLNRFESESELKSKDFEAFLLMLAPFAPFITEELWEKLGHKKSIHRESWPKHKAGVALEKTFELLFQVNGKLRGKAVAKTGIKESEAKEIALRDTRVMVHVAGKKIRRVIFVPNRLINIVI